MYKIIFPPLFYNIFIDIDFLLFVRVLCMMWGLIYYTNKLYRQRQWKYVSIIGTYRLQINIIAKVNSYDFYSIKYN